MNRSVVLAHAVRITGPPRIGLSARGVVRHREKLRRNIFFFFPFPFRKNEELENRLALRVRVRVRQGTQAHRTVLRELHDESGH